MRPAIALFKSLDRIAILLATNGLPRCDPDANQRFQAAMLLADPNLFLPPDVTPDLRFLRGNHFVFPSTAPAGLVKNDAVHGRFFPCGDDWRRHATVILLHGWKADFHYLFVGPRLARSLNRRGLNAILFELPHHMRRREKRKPGAAQTGFICGHIPSMLHATRQAIADLHALLLWARGQGCPAVAVWGFSLGAWLAGLYLCSTPGPAAALLTTPIPDLERAVAELPFCAPIRAALAVSPVSLAPLNLASLQPRIPPGRILLTEGGHDLFAPAGACRSLAAAWGLPAWDTFPHSHISLLFSKAAMERSMDWLAQTLATP